MKAHLFCIAGTCIALAAGCGSNPQKTQRPNVLDDKVTAERVQAALRRAGATFEHVSVRVDDGQVTLLGTVRSWDEKSRAEQIAHTVKRVEQVNDQLRVQQ
jgi:osmotically-inducible protein OsmY